MNRKAFSIIEVMLVLVIIAILANIAYPYYYNAELNAKAVQIVNDFNVIKYAVYMYYSDTGSFPKDGREGIIPAEFKQYLPEGFSFDRTKSLGIKYDWENWLNEDGQPLYPEQGILYGISFTCDDNVLAYRVIKLIPAQFKFSLMNRYTFIISNSE